MAVMIIIGIVGALILTIVGFFVIKQAIETLAIYIAIAAVVAVIIIIFIVVKKFKILEKIGFGKKK